MYKVGTLTPLPPTPLEDWTNCSMAICISSDREQRQELHTNAFIVAFQRPTNGIMKLNKEEIVLDHIIWNQSESETDPQAFACHTLNWYGSERVVEWIKGYGLHLPVTQPPISNITGEILLKIDKPQMKLEI